MVPAAARKRKLPAGERLKKRESALGDCCHASATISRSKRSHTTVKKLSKREWRKKLGESEKL
jgi:hypothetical protein